MSKKETAVCLFKHGHNCAQAIVCAYTDRYNIDDETAFRLSEGFGKGISGTGQVCGAISGMVMVASLAKCPCKDVEHTTKKETYPLVQRMCKEFTDKNEFLSCVELLKHKDNTLIDGKKAGCIQCVEDCCDIIEKYIGDKQESIK